MIYKIAVVGSRGFSNYDLFESKMKWFIKDLNDDVEFFSGGAKSGADFLIKRFCREYNYTLTEFLPEYDKYLAKIAPIKRNHTIVENSEYLIAFFDGVSKGTKYTLDLAEKAGLKIRMVKI